MKLSFTFNGEVAVVIYPESDADSVLLDLAFRGRSVREITLPTRGGETREALTLHLQLPEKPASRVRPFSNAAGDYGSGDSGAKGES